MLDLKIKIKEMILFLFVILNDLWIVGSDSTGGRENEARATGGRGAGGTILHFTMTYSMYQRGAGGTILHFTMTYSMYQRGTGGTILHITMTYSMCQRGTGGTIIQSHILSRICESQGSTVDASWKAPFLFKPDPCNDSFAAFPWQRKFTWRK